MSARSMRNRLSRAVTSMLEPLEQRIQFATVTVTSVADTETVDGGVTLREAIDSLDAHTPVNADVIATGAPYGTNDRIEFNIPGGPHTALKTTGVEMPMSIAKPLASTVQTIVLTSQLPALSVPMIIDGFTQPGSQANSLAVGDNSVHLIVLNGNNGVGETGFYVGSNTTIRGMVINGFTHDDISVGFGILATGSNDKFIGNFIGTDATGTFAVPNGRDGIFTGSFTTSEQIGGTSPADRNVISGNDESGIGLDGAATVYGNYIGTNAAGTAAIPNGEGIRYGDAQAGGLFLGSGSAGAGNLVSGNIGAGIDDVQATGAFIQGNLIGTDATGTLPIGNGGPGVLMPAGDQEKNVIGGLGNGNVIAFNLIGVLVNGNSSTNADSLNSIRFNSIFSNKTLGIDLSANSNANGDGATANDTGDGDNGGDGLQNYPVLTSATTTVSSTTVQASFNSHANTTYYIDFYTSSTVDASGFSEGQTYLGTTTVTTDGNGNATFSATLAPAGNAKYISATATTSATYPAGDTSEFSPPITLVTSIVLPTIAINDVTVVEGNTGTTPATFTVTRTGDTSGTSDLIWSTADGTATAGSDYIAVVNAPLHFAAGDASQQITVLVKGDTIVEPNETFFVNLSNVSGATLSDSQGQGTIHDDEPRISAHGYTNLVADKKPKYAFTGTVASFTDPDFLGANSYTAKINWGDGSTTDGQIVWDSNTSSWDIIGTHAYAKKGTYSMLITIQDANGATAVANSKLTA